jgi:hypothetical protein
MKGTFWTMLSASLLAGLLTWGNVPWGNDASAAQGHDPDNTLGTGKAEAVIIVCRVSPDFPPTQLFVAGFSKSSGAPEVQVGAQCAQALASVLSAGFRLRDVAIIEQLSTQYTLINR